MATAQVRLRARPAEEPMKFANPKAMAQHFAMLEATAPAKLQAIARTTLRGVEAQIKSVYGDEIKLQPPLADATIADKQRQGYDTPEPLIRTHALQESTRHEMDIASPGLIFGAVGTSDPIGFYQEAGTSKIPARPANAIGAMNMLVQIGMLASIGASSLATGNPDLAELEAFSLLDDAGERHDG